MVIAVFGSPYLLEKSMFLSLKFTNSILLVLEIFWATFGPQLLKPGKFCAKPDFGRKPATWQRFSLSSHSKEKQIEIADAKLARYCRHGLKGVVAAAAAADHHH